MILCLSKYFCWKFCWSRCFYFSSCYYFHKILSSLFFFNKNGNDDNPTAGLLCPRWTSQSILGVIDTTVVPFLVTRNLCRIPNLVPETHNGPHSLHDDSKVGFLHPSYYRAYRRPLSFDECYGGPFGWKEQRMPA